MNKRYVLNLTDYRFVSCVPFEYFEKNVMSVHYLKLKNMKHQKSSHCNISAFNLLISNEKDITLKNL